MDLFIKNGIINALKMECLVQKKAQLKPLAIT